MTTTEKKQLRLIIPTIINICSLKMPGENSLHLLDPLSLGKAIERSPVAQLVERVAVNHHVAGSSPARGAILNN